MFFMMRILYTSQLELPIILYVPLLFLYGYFSITYLRKDRRVEEYLISNNEQTDCSIDAPLSWVFI